jgi:hypothetical protein
MTLLRKTSTVTLAVAACLAVGCGGAKDDKVGGTGTPKVAFSDVNPLIVTYCGDAGCHGKTSPASVVYEDNEANFKASKKAEKSTATRMALATTDADYMPRGKTISSTDKQRLIDFLNQ